MVPHIIPPLPHIQLSTVEYPFFPVIPLNFEFFYEVLIILALDCFIIENPHVVVVRIILTNNHTKLLTQTSIGPAHLMDMLPMSKLRYISFSIKLLSKHKFSYIYKFFDKLTYSKLLTRTRTIEQHLMNLGFQMLFLQIIFVTTLKTKLSYNHFMNLV